MWLRSLRLYIIIILGALSNDSWANTIQDTIPPVFTTNPENISLPCTSPISLELERWINNGGNAVADQGNATVSALTSYDDALDALLQEFGINCSTSGKIEVGYIAIDSCNNQSIDTLFAAFEVHDRTPPDIIATPRSITTSCIMGIRDTLNNWLTTQGGAMLEDNCGIASWSHYTWSDNLGNTGFVDFADTTDIIIIRDSCRYHLDVSFFATDDCDNVSLTSAQFSVVSDTILPRFSVFPSDTTIFCQDTLEDVRPIAIDDCDGSLRLIETIISSQDSDTTLCNYYDYQIQKIWSIQDACGNEVIDTQKITVIDTLIPQVIYDPIKVIDCDTDLLDISLFLDARDNCSDVNISFTDSFDIINVCQQQIERVWSISDACNNTVIVNQSIQIQDFTAPSFSPQPENLIVHCDDIDIANQFDNWISNFANTTITDNCTEPKVLIKEIGIYPDTTSLLAAPDIAYKGVICQTGLADQIISQQTIGIYAYDLCGNIGRTQAVFQAIDTIPPSLECPEDVSITLDEMDCFVEHIAYKPSLIDGCPLADNSWEVGINGIEQISDITDDSTSITLEVGDHLLTYAAYDCGNNQGICTQRVIINDTIPPDLICPPDLTLFLDSSSCQYEYRIPSLVSFSDNCFGESDFEVTLPTGEGYINFEESPTLDTFIALDFPLEFENIITEGRVFKPTLSVDYLLDISMGSSVKIISEFGDILMELTEGDCTERKAVEILDINQFRVWANDGDIKFTVLFDELNGTGIHPCNNNNINGNLSTDNLSFLRLTLEFSDIVPNIVLTNAASDTINVMDNMVILETGEYSTSYSSSDRQGNTTKCTTQIEVIDTVAPMITCRDTTLLIPIEISEVIRIDQNLILTDINDNCGINNIAINPPELNCSDGNTSVQIIVDDINGNQSSCLRTVLLQPDTLSPFFVSGLCLADTLKLFSNVNPLFVEEYNWSGPNNFSANISDPILTSISDDNSGIYRIEIIAKNGCTYISTLDIDISQFDSPEISAPTTMACTGDMIILNSTSFNEVVEYFWYEGISPNGTLIEKTTGPSLSLIPIEGQHFYYVEVRGQNCASTPSNTLQIEIVPIPLAEIENPFLTLCEGESIALRSRTFGQNFSYEWRGPNGYFSNNQNAEVITDANNLNEGNYTLIVRDGVCISDTARAQVIIFDNPPQPIIVGENIFCEGQSAVLSVTNITNGTRYRWLRNGNFVSSTSTNSLIIPAISSDQSGSWTVIVEDGICNSTESDNFEIFVESSLTIGASNNGPICEGDSLTLTCSFIPTATYRWQDPSGIFFDGREIKVIGIEGIYTVSVTTSSNCNAITDTYVEVNPKPQVTALSNTSLPCMDGRTPITLVPSVFPPDNYSYQWTGPNNFSSMQESPVINNANEADNGDYQLIITKDNCSSDPVTTNVTITQIPERVTLSSNISPCENESLIININNPVTGTNIEWIWTTPNGQIVTQEPFLEIDRFTSTDEGEYTVTQIKNNCRSEESEALIIEIQQNPITPVISGDQMLCQGNSLSLEATNIPNAKYIWTTPQGIIEGNSSILVIDNINKSDEGSYSVVIQNGDCLSEESASFTVTVSEVPNALSFTSEDISVCASDEMQLEICIEDINTPFDIIQIIDANSGTIIQEGIETCFDLSFLLNGPIQSYQLSPVIIIEDCISEPIDIINIEIYDRPDNSAEISDDIIYLCELDFIKITPDFVPEEINIQWSSEDPDINIFQGQNNEYSFSNLRSGINTLYLQSLVPSCGVYATDTLSVIVLESLEAVDDSYEGSFGINNLVDVLANDNFTNELKLMIVESTSNGSVSVNENKIEYTPESNFVGSTNFVYEICYVECPMICDQATVTINIGENIECFAGNIITPNNDGYNDNLVIPCLNTGGYERNSITVFNQWGDEVFSAAPYENNWDATYNGKTIPVGTYFYILDLGDGSRPIQGFLTIEL